jgi:hypothetical protein
MTKTPKAKLSPMQCAAAANVFNRKIRLPISCLTAVMLVAGSAFAAQVGPRYQAESMTESPASADITVFNEAADEGSHARFSAAAGTANKLKQTFTPAEEVDQIRIRARLNTTAVGDDRLAVWVDGTGAANKVGIVFPPKGASYATLTLNLQTPLSANQSHTIYIGPNQGNDDYINFDWMEVWKAPRVNVTNYGAVANDSTNDTAAFENAMANAGLGDIVYVPAGVYRLAGVHIPSDTDLVVVAGATLKKFGSANGPLFIMEGPNDTTFATNIHVTGRNGRFMVDMNDAGQETGGFQLRNVKNFSLRNIDFRQNWDNHTQEAPSSRRPCISVLPTITTKTNGVYNHPTNGLFQNLHSTESPYGWGLTQLSGGEHLDFLDISSEGGVTLRLENYTNATPMVDIFADGVVCRNGHTAVLVNPHLFTGHGSFEIKNVTADGCESAISLHNENVTGSFAPSTITGVTVIKRSSGAQLRDPAPGGYVGAWILGPSHWCLDKESPLGYTVTITNLNCDGLPDR